MKIIFNREFLKILKDTEVTSEWFNEVVDQRCQKIKDTLAIKATEYSTPNDRFHNFRMAAIKSQETPMEALMGIKVKHTVSIDDMVNGVVEFNEDMINEKIGDEINYLILLEGMLKALL